MKHDDPLDTALRGATVSFFHQEIDARYRLAQLHEKSELQQEQVLEGITQEDLDTIKHFFRKVMYPPLDERERRDHSLRTLSGMLTDPSNLVSFFPSVPRIALKYGFLFPEAVKAGRDVLHAYHISTELEDRLVETLRERIQREGRPGDPDAAQEANESWPPLRSDEVCSAYAALPMKKARSLVTQVRHVVEHGKRRKLMDATSDILADLKKSTANQDRIAAVDYVIQVIQEVRGLADHYGNDKIDRLLRIAQIVENDYLDALSEG